MSFPASPNNGDSFTRFGRSYVYNSAKNKWSPAPQVSNTALTSLSTNILPAISGDVDIGATDKRIQDVYLESDSTIYIGDREVSSDSFLNSTNFAKNGDLTISTGTSRWYAPRNITISKITARLGTAADSIVTLEIEKNNSVEYNINIDIGEVQSISNTPINMTDVDYLQVNVTSVGSAAKGSDLNIQFIYN